MTNGVQGDIGDLRIDVERNITSSKELLLYNRNQNGLIKKGNKTKRLWCQQAVLTVANSYLRLLGIEHKILQILDHSGKLRMNENASSFCNETCDYFDEGKCNNTMEKNRSFKEK